MSRKERVSAALKRELSNIIRDEINDPRLGFITVTRVEMSADLRFARVYYSVLGNAEDKKNTQFALESASGYIRRGIGQRVDLRFVPELVFKTDDSCEYSIYISEQIEKLKQEDESKKSHRRNKKA